MHGHLAAWRFSGHRPLLASFRLNWKPWTASISNHQVSTATAPPHDDILADVVPLLRHLRDAFKQQLDVPPVKIRYPALPDIDNQVHAVWRDQQQRQISHRQGCS